MQLRRPTTVYIIEPSQLTARTDHEQTDCEQFCYSDFVTDFVAVISSLSEGFWQDGSGDKKNIFRIALLSQSMLFTVS